LFCEKVSGKHTEYENEVTKLAMRIFGRDKARGGSYTQDIAGVYENSDLRPTVILNKTIMARFEGIFRSWRSQKIRPIT